MFNSVFVALWHDNGAGQRIVRVEPGNIPTDPETLATWQPEPFMTGLLRPIDVTVAPDGSLVVVDSVYGHVWRVSYDG
jgi:glucose/arabinose dehydrogenase